MAPCLFLLCVLLIPACRAIEMPNYLLALHGASFDGLVNFTDSVVFTGAVNFTGTVVGAGNGAVPSTWTSSIDLTGTKTFSVTPSVAGVMTNVGIDTCPIGASTPAAATFTSLTCDTFTAVGNVLTATSTAAWFDSVYFGAGATGLVFEGSTDDGNEMYITVKDPSTGRAVVFPDADGTVCVSAATGLTLDATYGNMSVDASQPQITALGTVTAGTWASAVTGATIDNSPIGTTTPAAGSFSSLTVAGLTFLKLDGAIVDANILSLVVTEPTGVRTITFPDASGTLPLVQPSATDTVDLSLGAAILSDIFAVGTNLRVQGTGGTASVVTRAFLQGDGSYIEALEPSQTISGTLIMGTLSYLFMPNWGSGQLGDVTNPVIIATGSFMTMQQSTAAMNNWGIFGGGGHAMQNLGTGSIDSDNNCIFGGAGTLMKIDLTGSGPLRYNTMVGGNSNKATVTSTGGIDHGLVAGGMNNELASSSGATNTDSAIIAGVGNKIDAVAGVWVTGLIAGASSSFLYRSSGAAILGGMSNTLGNTGAADYAIILGGDNNIANHAGAVVMGSGKASDAVNSLSVGGDIYYTGTLYSISDARVKTNIAALGTTHALDLLMQLQPRNYTYHVAFAPLKGVSSTTYQVGLIAQEVEQVIPEAVKTGDTNITYHSEKKIPATYNRTTREVMVPAHYPETDVTLSIANKKSLDYSALIPYTVAALQELKTNADAGAFTTLSASSSLTLSDGVDMAVGSATGSRIGTSPTQKLAFYGATPVTQDATTGSVASYTLNTGNALNDASCSTGGLGSACLTLEDTVRILKKLGLAAL